MPAENPFRGRIEGPAGECPFSAADACRLLSRVHPALYDAITDALAAGQDADEITRWIRATVDRQKRPDNPQGGELVFNIAALTVEHLAAVAAQVSSCGRGRAGEQSGGPR